MYCPFCRHPDSRVVDSRAADDGTAIRRRRQCPACERRFTTVEQVTLAVVKRSGVTEPFVRTKVIDGVRKACKGRPVDEHALAQLAQRVEESIRGSGMAEIPAPEVGLAILGPLRELDEVAYLRFASVYRNFESADDFETEISLLRAEPGGPYDADAGSSEGARDRAVEGTGGQPGERAELPTQPAHGADHRADQGDDHGTDLGVDNRTGHGEQQGNEEARLLPARGVGANG